MNYEYLFKIIVLGDSKVGKSSLCCMACNDKILDEHYCETIALDFYTKYISVNGKYIKFHFWDTTGNPIYKKICTTYYKNMTSVILVYDVSNKQSFLNINNYLKEFKQHNTKRFTCHLIANKIDIKDKKVSRSQGIELAKKINATFHEMSLYNEENIANNIEIGFKDILNSIYDKRYSLDNFVSTKKHFDNTSYEIINDNNSKYKRYCCTIL
jgi:small GTP-binding protein